MSKKKQSDPLTEISKHIEKKYPHMPFLLAIRTKAEGVTYTPDDQDLRDTVYLAEMAEYHKKSQMTHALVFKPESGK